VIQQAYLSLPNPGLEIINHEKATLLNLPKVLATMPLMCYAYREILQGFVSLSVDVIVYQIFNLFRKEQSFFNS
jgi:hypothetical protein